MFIDLILIIASYLYKNRTLQKKKSKYFRYIAIYMSDKFITLIRLMMRMCLIRFGFKLLPYYFNTCRRFYSLKICFVFQISINKNE